MSHNCLKTAGLHRLGLTLGLSIQILGGEQAAHERPVDGIMDNSFLVEEAYNQEAGVVQHIVNTVFLWDLVSGSEDRTTSFTFTQEWPIFSQKHQFSYTIPYTWLDGSGSTEDGIGDILLNYRYQAYFNPDTLRAFAPRVSLVLPSGNEDRGLGDDTVGVQLNLPYSQTLGARWFIHANAGSTFLPDSGAPYTADRVLFNLGGSAIYAVSRNLHLMLEWVGIWNDVPVSMDQTEYEFTTLISPGLRYAVNLPKDAQLVLGLAAPIGLNRASPDYGVFLYLSFEHFFHRED